MATEVLVTSREFENLKDPYTGKPMRVKMIVGVGPEPLFHAPDTFSTGDLQKSTNRLYELWSRVDGRQGLRSGAPRCAYTGKPMTVVEFGGQYHFIGGFDPHVLRTRDEFLYYATMRDGKATRDEPSPVKLRVTKPRADARPSDSQRRHADSVTPDVSQASIDIAQEQIERHKGELPLPTKTGYTGKGKRR